jgi:hypothetical protein
VLGLYKKLNDPLIGRKVAHDIMCRCLSLYDDGVIKSYPMFSFAFEIMESEEDAGLGSSKMYHKALEVYYYSLL